MKTFRFDPGMSFREARDLLRVVSGPEHAGQIAKMIWLEGEDEGKNLTYLWDALAERFGHNIDKEPIDRAVVENLINDIAVEIRVQPPKK